MGIEMKGHKPMKVFKIIGMIVAGLITAVIVAFLFGYFVQWLWNWLMPQIFHLERINFWQAFGLVLLFKLLLGHLGTEHEHNHHYHAHHQKVHTCFKKHRSWCSDCDNGDWKDGTYYEDWWKHEGKEAFQSYVSRKNDETHPDPKE
jgi:hypothetical protein